jgi:hypothetical protein
MGSGSRKSQAGDKLKMHYTGNRLKRNCELVVVLSKCIALQ